MKMMCPVCNGRGDRYLGLNESRVRRCDECGGTGTVDRTAEDSDPGAGLVVTRSRSSHNTRDPDSARLFIGNNVEIIIDRIDRNQVRLRIRQPPGPDRLPVTLGEVAKSNGTIPPVFR